MSPYIRTETCSKTSQSGIAFTHTPSRNILNLTKVKPSALYTEPSSDPIHWLSHYRTIPSVYFVFIALDSRSESAMLSSAVIGLQVLKVILSCCF